MSKKKNIRWCYFNVSNQTMSQIIRKLLSSLPKELVSHSTEIELPFSFGRLMGVILLSSD